MQLEWQTIMIEQSDPRRHCLLRGICKNTQQFAVIPLRQVYVDCEFNGALIVGQGPIALAVGAGGGCLDIFTLIYPFSSLSPSLWETARYRLNYCLKGPLNPKQPTNQPKSTAHVIWSKTTQSNVTFGRIQRSIEKILKWNNEGFLYKKMRHLVGIYRDQGRVVQSIDTLTSSLRGQLVKGFTTSLLNRLIFFIEKMKEAFAM